MILKHFWWFQSKLNYYSCINLITLREPIPVQSGESLKFAVAQFSWLHRCMLICFKWYTSYIYAQDLPNVHICICEWTVLYVQSLIEEYISYSCKLVCHLGPKLEKKRFIDILFCCIVKLLFKLFRKCILVSYKNKNVHFLTCK